MKLIKSDIINPVYDALWEDIGPMITGLIPRPVLVITNDFATDSAESVQLQKMMDACKLKTEQYNIIKLNGNQLIAWRKLKEFLKPDIIFLIGILPAQLGISALFNLNFPNSFDGCIWLPTLSINDLAKNDDMKKQLWISGMKPVFVDRPVAIAPQDK